MKPFKIMANTKHYSWDEQIFPPMLWACFIAFVFIVFPFSLPAQNPDSLKFYLSTFSDKSLSVEERKAAGVNIREIQKVRYYNSRNPIQSDTSIDMASKSLRLYQSKIDSIADYLFLIVADESLKNWDRYKVLVVLAGANNYRIDSFLLTNIVNFNYLGEIPHSSTDEINWMYPCFNVLGEKSYKNYNLIQPITDQLGTTKTETEVFLLKHLLLNVFNHEDVLLSWLENLLINSDNQILTKNLEEIKNSF